MSELQKFRSEEFAIKRANLETGVIEGYASVFRKTPDAHGDRFRRGAYIASLAKHRDRGTRPSMLWGHDPREVIGQWTKIVEDAHGLYAIGKLNLDVRRAQEAFSLIKNGDVAGLSVGAHLNRTTADEKGTVILEADLVEISLVHSAADDEARVSAFKHLATKKEAIDFLRSAGLSKSAATRFAAGGFPALAKKDTDHAAALDLAEKVKAATSNLRKIK